VYCEPSVEAAKVAASKFLKLSPELLKEGGSGSAATCTSVVQENQSTLATTAVTTTTSSTGNTSKDTKSGDPLGWHPETKEEYWNRRRSK
jgi:hypothetical protein